MEQAWRQALQQGGMILTVNRRLSRVLSDAYADAMEAEGLEFWATPAILPMAAWLEECWNRLLDQAEQCWPDTIPPFLLREEQEAWVWESVLTSTPGAGTLLRPGEAARAAREAADLLTEYGLDLPPHEVVEHEDGAAFLVWRQRFERLCAQGGWVGKASLTGLLLPLLSRLPLPEWIGLAGFDQLTPRLEALMKGLREAGCQVERLPMPSCARHAVALPCREREEECHLAARWARHLLESGQARSVGIVVPELSQLRAQVARHLEEVFIPGFSLPGAEETEAPFEISAALPLAQAPMVADGLRVLALLLGEPLEPPEYGALLHSPFWGGPLSEWGSRARLDARLRQKGVWSLDGARLAVEARSLTLGTLLERVLGPERRLAGAMGREAPVVWAERFTRWLHALGWPGERPLSSAEHQSVEAWREVLTELAALGAVCGEMGAGEALERVRRMARERPFQPEGAADAPLRVVGVLEAAGLTFDALWILGISDAVWPPMPAPNPFIPVALQRRHGLPRATAEGELLLAESITRRLLEASPRIVASYPLLDGDQPMRISPLLAHLPVIAPEELHLPEFPAFDTRIHAAARLEFGQDAQAPPHPGGEVEGGTGLLRAQSHCPFQGFSRFRLQARRLEEPQPGLTPGERGELVHEVLARFWEEVVSLERLQGMEEQALEEVLAHGVQSALARCEQKWNKTLPPVLRQLEAQRLLRLVREWLLQERTRAPFQVVEREASHPFAVAGLGLKVRMDRVDRLAEGGRVILDYKTGAEALSIKALLGQRPREPQLALYALLEGEEPVRGVAFAKVRRGEMGFHGVAESAQALPRVALAGDRNLPGFADWGELISHWRTAVESIGQSWRAGEAGVEPLKGVCKNCDLTPLCRITEQKMASDEEGSDGDE